MECSVKAIPSYYRHPNPFYPENVSFSSAGAFAVEVEQYLGQSAADCAFILGNKLSVYSRFSRLHLKSNANYVDYNRPEVEAFYNTFICPVTMGKGVLKTHKDRRHSLMPAISLIVGLFSFSTAYLVNRDILTVLNAADVIKKTGRIKDFLFESKKANAEIEKDPIYQRLNKIAALREQIYKRVRASSIFNLITTVTMVAAVALAIVGFSVSLFPLWFAGVSIIGGGILSLAIKAIAEANNRLDRPHSQTILQEVEKLKDTPLSYDPILNTLEFKEEDTLGLKKKTPEVKAKVVDPDHEKVSAQYEQIQMEEVKRNETNAKRITNTASRPLIKIAKRSTFTSKDINDRYFRFYVSSSAGSKL